MSKQKNNKRVCAVITAISALMLLGISASADTTSSTAESVPNTAAQTTTTAPTTTPAPSTTAVTTPKTESSPESKPENSIPENPFTSGMLSDDELYEYIADYLNTGSSLDTDGSAVLIGEDIINKNESNTSNADNSTDAETPSSAGEKVMYTFAAKDGSTFYIIIDKGAGGENVYFLNKVDIVDLASLIGTKDSDKLTAQEKQIVAAANGITVSQLDETLKDDNSSDNDTQSNNTSKPNSSDNNTSKPAQTAQKDDTIMYIIIGGAFLLAIIIGYYVKVVKKKKEKGFDEQDDYEEENAEEYINEDEDE